MQEETGYAHDNPETFNKALELIIHRYLDVSKNFAEILTAVAILERLFRAANQRDFPLHLNDTSKINNRPEQYRDVLLYIYNQFHAVLRKAHNNTVKISWLMKQVQKHVDSVVEIWKFGNQASENKLTEHLKAIKEAVEESANLSKELVDTFAQLGKLISNVIETISLTEGQKIPQEKARLKNSVSSSDTVSRRGVEVETVRPVFEPTKQEKGNINNEIRASNNNVDLKIINFPGSQPMENNMEFLQDIFKNLSELNVLWLFNPFRSLDNIIDVETRKILSHFCEEAKMASEDAALVQYIADFTLQSSLQSYLIFSVAEMYVNVSGRYIMNCVELLGKMITASGNVEEVQLARICQEASEGIKAMVLEGKQKLKRDISQRWAKFDGSLLDLAPLPTSSHSIEFEDDDHQHL